VIAGAGSRLRAVTGGGGGYGPPLEREHELVAADIADGYVSAGAAADLYGYQE
jgi:N-methylhydantoinase B/oxoprolinase/acetone carboxylase alpha subunit